ncbi:MAG: hypothetical protein V4726_22320 [Verrucomicrobiota bacterium]
MNRLNANPKLKKEIQTRFDYTCAACGIKSKLISDVAHLYENATICKPRADTLIVLCANCNQGEARSKLHYKPALSELFTGDEVLARARRSYREGRYSCAYAGFRLAAYLFDACGWHSKAVACLIEAISALRPIRWGDFISSTLLEIERLCRNNKIGLVQIWLCLDRFSLVLYDYCRWKEAAEMQYAAMQISIALTSDQRYPEQLKFDRANSLRREALIKGSTAALGQCALRKFIDRLLEDAELFKQHGQFDSYATNLDVAGKLALEIDDKPKESYKYGELAIDCIAKITHKWVLQEHYWRQADFYLLKKDYIKMKNSVIEALRIYRDHPVVLEPILTPKGPVPNNPILKYEKKYKLSNSELRDLCVAPSSNPPVEIPLQLSREKIECVVKNIIKSGI